MPVVHIPLCGATASTATIRPILQPERVADFASFAFDQHSFEGQSILLCDRWLRLPSTNKTHSFNDKTTTAHYCLPILPFPSDKVSPSARWCCVDLVIPRLVLLLSSSCFCHDSRSHLCDAAMMSTSSALPFRFPPTAQRPLLISLEFGQFKPLCRMDMCQLSLMYLCKLKSAGRC